VFTRLLVLIVFLGASLNSQAESIPADAIIKVCGKRGAYENMVVHKCKNGDDPQILDKVNLGPLQLPSNSREARRAQEQVTELNGLPAGEKDFHNIDRFTLSCEDDIEYRYFDIYHCEKKSTPPS